MSDAAAAYRWNTFVVAEAFDAAAVQIHPFNRGVQDQILAQLRRPLDEPALVVDLGGGLARLVERIWKRFSSARAVGR